ncbi:MAG: hypothetical protein GF383_12525 [Candidatus Lokiarchaeota archaeon]|nr:hypothetical protein [Candidatus Lokiarchaeota archaeon]MBD3341850.1 hypothetical protein [Candidatus Lokiarchaeota archaeon]
MELLLNTIRLIDYDQVKEFALGDESSLKEKLAIAFLNPEDFNELGLVPSLRIKIWNDFGEIIVEQETDEDIPKGMITMPVSIWSNQITKVENKGVKYKNIKVKVEPTRDQVMDFKELLKKIKQS